MSGESTGQVWTAAVAAWLLAVPLWYVAKFAVVVAHEGGHAIVAKLLFQKVLAVRIDKAGGGVTEHSEPPLLFHVLVKAAGYLGPSAYGLVGAWLLARDQVEAVLWGSLGFLAVMLIVVRGLVGWLVVPALMGLIFLVTIQVEPPLLGLLAHVWVWLLLIGAVERMLAFMTNKTYQDEQSDAGALAKITRSSGELWAVVFLIGTIAALVYGGTLMLRG